MLIFFCSLLWFSQRDRKIISSWKYFLKCLLFLKWKVKLLKKFSLPIFFFFAFKRHEHLSRRKNKEVLWEFFEILNFKKNERNEWNETPQWSIFITNNTREWENKTNKPDHNLDYFSELCALLWMYSPVPNMKRWTSFLDEKQQQHNTQLSPYSHSHMMKLKPDELAMQSQKKKEEEEKGE